MKKPAKTDRPVQPISLAPRKPTFKVMPETSPHRSDWDVCALKTIDSNRQVATNNAFLNTMKKDLNMVKQDVEKLFTEENCTENSIGHRLEVQTLKDELEHAKQVEKELRRELKQCRSKLQQQPEDRYKSDREKEIINERLVKLQQELLEAQRSTQLKEDIKTQKLQQLSREFDKVSDERNFLHDECVRLGQLVEQLQRPKMDQDTQHNEDEVLDVRRRMHDIEKERLAMAGRLKEKELELRKTCEQHQTTIREKDAKYNSCLNEFKKLEQKLSRPREDFESKSKLQQLEQLLFSSRQLGETLRSENHELIGKVERLRVQYEQQRHINDEMAAKVRHLHNQISQAHRNELLELETKVQHLESSLVEAHKRYEQKCRQQQHERTRSQTVSHPTSNDELHRTKVQVLTLEIQLNQLHGEMQRQRQDFKTLEELSSQKDNYIRELQKQRELMERNPHIEVEARCRQLYEDQSRMAQEYRARILELEIMLQRKSEEYEQLRSDIEVARHQLAPVSFEAALKQQLTENQQLRLQLKTKSEQLLILRNQLEDTRRRADSIKSQTDLDKLRGLTEQKTLKGHYDILLQNLKSDLESQKRKFECLQRKADFRGEQLRKKDEFIQQVIIGKVRPADQSESDYLRKQLQRFFSANYEGRLLGLQERIAELENTQPN